MTKAQGGLSAVCRVLKMLSLFSMGGAMLKRHFNILARSFLMKKQTKQLKQILAVTSIFGFASLALSGCEDGNNGKRERFVLL
jgi:hypothetical protein